MNIIGIFQRHKITYECLFGIFITKGCSDEFLNEKDIKATSNNVNLRP